MSKTVSQTQDWVVCIVRTGYVLSRAPAAMSPHTTRHIARTGHSCRAHRSDTAQPSPAMSQYQKLCRDPEPHMFQPSMSQHRRLCRDPIKPDPCRDTKNCVATRFCLSHVVTPITRSRPPFAPKCNQPYCDIDNCVATHSCPDTEELCRDLGAQPNSYPALRAGMLAMRTARSPLSRHHFLCRDPRLEMGSTTHPFYPCTFFPFLSFLFYIL